MQYVDPQYLELFNITGKKSSDIFGLGIILWEISSDNNPFEMESSSDVCLLNNIAKGKRETAISGTPLKYKKYTLHDETSRPDIFQVAKNLSEIIISDESVEFEPPQSQPYNVIDVKLGLKLIILLTIWLNFSLINAKTTPNGSTNYTQKIY
ncbi:hypothetical protein Glove_65g158 [Diversispora epigaea]|uniref:Protein kinase domain-containing protein n=1 Tax=Diversispora epigaea TaxID=1348612 RepID=A0A397JHM7_9GLOM|nr:hypothetical protein Glove_65g158 [Diversispora epigaea]